MPATNEAAYAALLSRIAPVVIRNEVEHDRLRKEVNHLMEKGDRIKPEEEELLALLGRLLEDYESHRFHPGKSATPHSILRHLMEARGLKHKDVWPLFGSKGIASEVLNGKRGISKTQAKTLAAFFHVSVDLFL